jgi:hypothetical protein
MNLLIFLRGNIPKRINTITGTADATREIRKSASILGLLKLYLSEFNQFL